MAAQYSLPFVVGATLEFGPTDHGAFAPENLTHDRILHWADLLKVEPDESLQAQYPEHFGSEVEASFADGSVRTERVLDSRGTPANPFNWRHLIEKAENMTAGCRPALALDRLQSLAMGMRDASDIQPFIDLLAVEVTNTEKPAQRSPRTLQTV